MNNTNEQSLQTEQIIIPITVAKDHSHTKKLTALVKQDVINFLLKDFNLTKAAASVGVTRRTVERSFERDTDFHDSFKLARSFHLDNCKEAMFVVASAPSREGYNDRRMALSAYEPERFGNKVQVQSTHTVNVKIEMPELNRILQGQNVQKAQLPEAIPDAEIVEILTE